MGRFGSPDALARWYDLGAPSGSVELKALLELPAGPVAETLTGRPSPTWSVRRMYLLDTPAMDLVSAGVEVRLRRRARGRHDLSVSTRRSGAAPDAATPRDARVELDVVPGAAWRDIEVRREIDGDAAAAVIAGSATPGALLSRAQRRWVCEGGDRVVDGGRLGELRVHGPLVVHRVKVAARRHGLRRADLEHVRYPSGRERLEVSTRCTPADLSATAAAFDRLLDERGVVVTPTYRTKTAVWREDVGP